jgi:hypothetical protein
MVLKEIAKMPSKSHNVHFYILQDIISSFECYAKPIIDIANGVKKEIPGLHRPSNLFFIRLSDGKLTILVFWYKALPKIGALHIFKIFYYQFYQYESSGR